MTAGPAVWLAGNTLSSARCPWPSGISTVNVLPVPGWLSAVMLPPCSPTSSLARARPMPLPSLDRAWGVLPRWKRSNRCGMSWAAMPIPVSATRSTAWPSTAARDIRTEPATVYFRALLSRLSTTFSHISRST